MARNLPTICLVLAALAISLPTHGQSTIQATWQPWSGTWNGDWDYYRHWSGLGGSDTYPHNNSLYLYNVVLPEHTQQYTSTVDLDSLELLSIDIGQWAILRAQTSSFRPGQLAIQGQLRLEEGDLFLDSSVTNNGDFFVEYHGENTSLHIESTLEFSGDGHFGFDATTGIPENRRIILAPGQELINDSGHILQGGTGLLLYEHGEPPQPGRIMNHGRLLATGAGATFELRGDQADGSLFDIESGGIIKTESSARMEIRNIRDFSNYGSMFIFNTSAMQLDSVEAATIRGVFLCEGTLEITGGTPVLFDGTLCSNPGSIYVEDGSVEFSNDPDLATGTIDIQNGSISVNDDVIITVGDAYTHRLTNEQNHDFHNSGALGIINFRTVSHCDFDSFTSIEAAGQDLGNSPAGHENNFQLPKLSFERNAKAKLVDEIDNGNRNGIGGQAEALYVGSIIFEGSGNVLDLNGIHLYVNEIIGQGVIVDSSVNDDCNDNSVPDACDIASGTSQDENRNRIPDDCETFGDFTGDGQVTLDDLVHLTDALAGPGVTPSPPGDLQDYLSAFDNDADGDIDLADIAAFQENFGH